MDMFWQHLFVALPGIVAAVLGLINRRHAKQLKVLVNGNLSRLIKAIEKEKETDV